MKLLRDYQNDGIAAVNAALSRGITKQIKCFATGLGKTLTATRILQNYQRTLWITHRQELITQSANVIIEEQVALTGKLDLHFLGIIKQERCEIHNKVVVASIQTLHRRLDQIPSNWFDCIIVDECHLAASVSFKKALDHFKPKLLLGLTATPYRLDGLSLGDIFQEIVIERDISYGITNGYLVELEGIQIRTNTDLNKVRTTGGELNQGDLEKAVNTPARNNLIAESWLKYAPGQPTLGFASSIQHAVDITKTFREKGIKADFVCSDEKLCPNRTQRIGNLVSRTIDVLWNVDIMTVGVDIPFISCTIAARPTKSLTVYMQGPVGRGTRTVVPLHTFNTVEERVAAIQASSKPKCIILDIVDATGRHSLVNTWTLDKEKPTEEKVFKTREQKLAIITARNAKIKHELKEDRKVTLLALPKFGVKRSNSNAHLAGPNQLKWLKDLGYDIENNVFTVADCAEIIGNSPATEKQLWRVKKEGYDISGGLTYGQAKLVIDEVENKKRIDFERHLTKDAPFSDLL